MQLTQFPISYLWRIAWLPNSAGLIPLTTSKLCWTFNKNILWFHAHVVSHFPREAAKVSFEKMNRLTTSWILMICFSQSFLSALVCKPCFSLKLFIYVLPFHLKDKDTHIKKERQTVRDLPSTGWLSTYPWTAVANPGQRKEPVTQSGPSTWVARPCAWVIPCGLPGCTLVRNVIGSRGARTQPGTLVCCVGYLTAAPKNTPLLDPSPVMCPYQERRRRWAER